LLHWQHLTSLSVFDFSRFGLALALVATNPLTLADLGLQHLHRNIRNSFDALFLRTSSGSNSCNNRCRSPGLPASQTLQANRTVSKHLPQKPNLEFVTSAHQPQGNAVTSCGAMQMLQAQSCKSEWVRRNRSKCQTET